MKTQRTRNTKELLILLRDNMDLLTSGMCQLALRLSHKGIMTDNEYEKVRTYLNNHKPKNLIPERSLWWWFCGEKEPRLKWLNRHIKIQAKREKE